MSKFLVIGASSFTGRIFCEYAKSLGSEVWEASLRHDRVGAVEFEYVVNFAAANVVAPSWDWPLDYMKANVDLQIPFWGAMRKWSGLKRYIHISTPEVYGSTRGLVKEDAPYNPSTPYAVSRAAAEMMLKCYHRQYGFPVVFTRSCNVYGPGQQLYRLIPKLIVSIKKGMRFPLEGGGHSHRSFIHVRDACDAIWRIAMKGETGTAYHISSPVSFSIAFLVETVCKMMGVKMSDVVDQVMERPGKDAQYVLDDTRIRRLGWNDTIDIRQGIIECIDWIEKDWDTIKDLPMEYVHRP